MSDDIVFGPPPPDGRLRNVRREWVEALRARPGEWAKVATKSSPGVAGRAAREIRLPGALAYLRGDVWESATRGCDIYARYIGPAK